MPNFNKASGVYFKSCDKSSISYAEQRIIDCLNKNNIPFYREVIFKGFFSPAGGQFRFDFYFPRISTIIEYDGEQYHKDKQAKDRDKIKTAFCLSKEITLYRLNKTHWKNLEAEVLKCLKQL